MYKVFFDDRTVFFGDDFSRAFTKHKGLFYKYNNFIKLIEVGGGVVLNDSGEFPMIHRKGTWDLPKGKLEAGEDFRSAAFREVEEETGLSGLQVIEPLVSTYHTYHLEDKHILKKTKWFEMHYSGEAEPVLQAREGITDCRWVKPGSTGFIRENSYASILDVLYMRNLL